MFLSTCPQKGERLRQNCPSALTEHHAMKAYWGSGGVPRIFTSALDGGEWSASRPGRFIRRERAPGTHWIGGWVGRIAGPHPVVKIEISSPYRDSNPQSSSP
jgi:hypothetical protein